MLPLLWRSTLPFSIHVVWAGDEPAVSGGEIITKVHEDYSLLVNYRRICTFSFFSCFFPGIVSGGGSGAVRWGLGGSGFGERE